MVVLDSLTRIYCGFNRKKNHGKSSEKTFFNPFDVATPFRKMGNSDLEPENDDFPVLHLLFHFGPCLSSVFVFGGCSVPILKQRDVEMNFESQAF